MTRLLFQSIPDTQKFSRFPLTSAAYTMPLKQRCHHVAARGTPLRVSLIISLFGLVSILIGYALEASAPSFPFTVTPRTSSSPRSSLEASPAEMKGASLMAGKAGTTRVGRKGTASSVLPGGEDRAITTAAIKIVMGADADRNCVYCCRFIWPRILGVCPRTDKK